MFEHLLALDLRFHLGRRTGEVSRVLDRGSRSINFVLSAMVFNVVPTILEIGLVSAILGWSFGPSYAGVVVGTLAAYTAFTIGVTQWRTQFRKDMNRMENQASSRAVDALINYETIKYFGNEGHEAKEYDAKLGGYQEAWLRTQTSLSFLNFGQNAIFSVGLSSVMLMAANGII